MSLFGALFSLLIFKVLHQLDDTANGGKFPVVEGVSHGAGRVMRSRGNMIIGETLSLSIKKALWCYHLNEA